MTVENIKTKVIKALEMIYDPEIPVNIYQLGLIYAIDVQIKENKVFCDIKMTLTSPACSVSELLFEQVNNIQHIVEEIDVMQVELVFDPPWTQEKMSYEAKLELGLL